MLCCALSLSEHKCQIVVCLKSGSKSRVGRKNFLKYFCFFCFWFGRQIPFPNRCSALEGRVCCWWHWHSVGVSSSPLISSRDELIGFFSAVRPILLFIDLSVKSVQKKLFQISRLKYNPIERTDHKLPENFLSAK